MQTHTSGVEDIWFSKHNVLLIYYYLITVNMLLHSLAYRSGWHIHIFIT